MKNYDIKNAAEELANKKVMTIGNRIAFLVPNMFKRVENGFLKNIPVKPVVEEQPVIETPIQNVQSIQENVNVQVEQPVQQSEVVQTGKPYILKVNESDMLVFKNGVKTDNNPKRLLISTAFKNKLVANRASKLVKDAINVVSNSIDDLVNKYHELIDKRSNLIEEVRSIEQEITRLVKENNLTQEQVNRTRVI